MRTVCATCETPWPTSATTCPECGTTAKGHIYEQDEAENGQLRTPPGFMNPAAHIPDWLRSSAWLWTDDSHQPGGGASAYRVVYKTLGTPVGGTVNLQWPNLQVRIWHGTTKTGHAHIEPSHPWRRDNHRIVPEWGTIETTGDHGTYRPTQLSSPHLSFDEVTHEGGSYVEAILHTTATNPTDQIVEGRRHLASLITMIDLSFGPRILGIQLTEEIGELFEDGHFICSAQSELFGLESQLVTRAISSDPELHKWATTIVDRHTQRPEEEAQRLRLACDWYQLAGATNDPVLEFIHLWLAIEVLAMDGTNIKPVRKHLIAGLGGSDAHWAQPIGMLFRIRGQVIHGKARTVEDRQLQLLREIVEALLEIDFGWVNLPRRNRLATELGFN